MPFLLLRLIVLLGSLILPTNVRADPLAHMWVAKIGAEEYGIRFARDGDRHCGLMHWMEKPKLNGEWKLDAKNPNEALRCIGPYSSWAAQEGRRKPLARTPLHSGPR